jgi:hypothetical protein
MSKLCPFFPLPLYLVATGLQTIQFLFNLHFILLLPASSSTHCIPSPSAAAPGAPKPLAPPPPLTTQRQPSRPAPPVPTSSSSSNNNNSSNEGPQWSCSECTFLNHPALDQCEECEMPRDDEEEYIRLTLLLQIAT